MAQQDLPDWAAVGVHVTDATGTVYELRGFVDDHIIVRRPCAADAPDAWVYEVLDETTVLDMPLRVKYDLGGARLMEFHPAAISPQPAAPDLDHSPAPEPPFAFSGTISPLMVHSPDILDALIKEGGADNE